MPCWYPQHVLKIRIVSKNKVWWCPVHSVIVLFLADQQRLCALWGGWNWVCWLACKNSYQVLVDLDYFPVWFSCANSCPVTTRAQEWVRAAGSSPAGRALGGTSNWPLLGAAPGVAPGPWASTSVCVVTVTAGPDLTARSLFTWKIWFFPGECKMQRWRQFSK